MKEDIEILEKFFEDRMDVEEEKWALRNIVHELEYNKVQFATQLREKLDLRADSIQKSKVEEKLNELKILVDKYEQQMENDQETDLSYEEVRDYTCKIEVLQELLKN